MQLGNFGNELVFIDTSGATLSGTAMPSTTVLQSFPIINARFDFAVGSSSGNFALATLNSLSFAPVPEPSTSLLLALGLAGLAAMRRRSLLD